MGACFLQAFPTPAPIFANNCVLLSPDTLYQSSHVIICWTVECKLMYI